MSVPNTTKSKYLKPENYFWVVWLRAVHPSQKYYSQLWGIYPRLESEALEPTAANLPMVSQDWLEILKSPCWMEYIYIYIYRTHFPRNHQAPVVRFPLNP